MSSAINELISLSKEVSSNKEEQFVPRLMFIFSKELHITPTEFLSLEIPLVYDLSEQSSYNRVQPKSILQLQLPSIST